MSRWRLERPRAICVVCTDVEAFWHRFIDEISFDHPDQPPPRHGGNNWIRIPLPEPAGWMTAYRSEGNGKLGFFFKLPGRDGPLVFEALREDASQLIQETGLPIVFADDGYVVATLPSDAPEVLGEAKALAWLKRGANALVTALRPRISRWRNER